MFGLTVGGNTFKKDVTNLISKTIIVKQEIIISLADLSVCLSNIKIKGLHLIVIDMKEVDVLEVSVVEGPSKINLVVAGLNRFINDILNSPKANFLDFNKNSLYILKNGDYKDIKNLFVKIEGNHVNVVRGSSQKSHLVSPLELRLSSYMMALCNFDYNYLSSLNKFNDLSKNRYLALGNKE